MLEVETVFPPLPASAGATPSARTMVTTAIELRNMPFSFVAAPKEAPSGARHGLLSAATGCAASLEMVLSCLCHERIGAVTNGGPARLFDVTKIQKTEAEWR